MSSPGISDTEAKNLRNLSLLSMRDVKYANFSVLLLLAANHFPSEVEDKDLKECLAWDSLWYPNHNPPQYLLNSLGRDHNVTCLRKLLFASFVTLRGLPLELEARSCGHRNAISEFLIASRCYRESNFDGALACASAIDSTKCSSVLQGWVLWLIGLTLVRLDKPALALVKFEAALERSRTCLPALFNVWQVYRKKLIVPGELLALKGLSMVSSMQFSFN